MKTLKSPVVIRLVLVALLSVLCLSVAQISAKDVVTLTFWNNNTEEQPAWDKLSDAFLKKTGGRVRFKSVAMPPGTYWDKITAAAGQNDLPDLFMPKGAKRERGELIPAGHVLNLAPYLNADNKKWAKLFFPAELDGMFYTKTDHPDVPEGFADLVYYSNSAFAVFYNRDLMRKAGLNPNKPPQTIQEMIAMCKTVQKKVDPKVGTVAIGMADGWKQCLLWLDWAMVNMDAKTIADTADGKIGYNAAGWLATTKVFEDMAKAGLFNNGCVTMKEAQAVDLFASNGALFLFDGSWSNSWIIGRNPQLDWGSMPIPTPVKGKRTPNIIQGGGGQRIVANGKGQHVKETVEFMKFLTSNEGQKIYCSMTLNLPSIMTIKINNDPRLKGFIDSMINNAVPKDYTDATNKLDPGIAWWYAGQVIQNIVTGEKTAEQVVADIQAENVKRRSVSK